MDLLVDDTIAALASAPGPAVRGIIRISGTDVIPKLNRLFAADDGESWNRAGLPRRHSGFATVADLRSPIPVDVLLWPNARSYTGQPMAELHTVGSPPVLEALLAELHRRGIRAARPGEFTLRAFLNGRIDLVQAEAVLGVIDSTDHVALECALQQLAGGISGRIRALHEDLVDLLADLEAGLDFVEEDIEFVTRDDILRRLQSAASVVAELRKRAVGRMVSSARVRVVLAGLPNAGKSTLFNALVGREAALVSTVRGTTRDYLRADVECGGLPVELIDTAGWDHAGKGIAGFAQELRDEQMQRADVVVWCTAADLDPRERQFDDQLQKQVRESATGFVRVRTKSDLQSSAVSEFSDEVRVSAMASTGLSDLAHRIRETLGSRHSDSDSLLGTTAARCGESLRTAAESVSRAISVARSEFGDELIAAELHEIIDALGEIVGTVYTDDLLGRIFSKFCIGK